MRLLLLLLLTTHVFCNQQSESRVLRADKLIKHKVEGYVFTEDKFATTEYEILQLQCVGGSACSSLIFDHKLYNVTVEKKDGIWLLNETSIPPIYNITSYKISCTDPNNYSTCQMTYRLDFVNNS